MPSPIDSQLKTAFDQKKYPQIKVLLEAYTADNAAADAKAVQPRAAVTIDPAWWGQVTQGAGNDAGTILHLMRKAGGKLPNVTQPLPTPKFKFFFPILGQPRKSNFVVELQDAINCKKAKLVAKLISKAGIYDLALFSKKDITAAFVLLTMIANVDAINKLFHSGLVDITQACMNSPLLTNAITSAQDDAKASMVVRYLLDIGVKETIYRFDVASNLANLEIKKEFFYATQSAHARKFVKTKTMLESANLRPIPTPASTVWRLKIVLAHKTLTFIPNVVLAELLCDLIHQDKDEQAAQLLKRIMQDYAYGALLTAVSFTKQLPIHIAARNGKQQLVEQMLLVAPYTQLHAEDVKGTKPQDYAKAKPLKAVLDPNKRDVDLIDYDWYVTHLNEKESLDKKRYATLANIKCECKSDNLNQALHIKQHLTNNKDKLQLGKNVNNSISNRLREQDDKRLVAHGKVLLAYCEANNSAAIYKAKQEIIAACAKTELDYKKHATPKVKTDPQTAAAIAAPAAVMLQPVYRA